MSLVTPDFGLLFWMVLIFGIVLFILWKFAFPIITGMVDKRSERISNAIRLARDAEERLQKLSSEQEKLVEEARRQQADILREAAAERKEIVEKAKEEAREEAAKILSAARTEIAAEKESALRDVRSQVAALSVGIAEKVLRAELSSEKARQELADRLADEV